MLDRFHSQFQMFSELSLIFCLLANTGKADSDVKGSKNQAFLCVAVMCFNSFFNDTVGRNSAPVEVGNLSRYLRGFKNIQPVVISSIKSSRLHPTVSLPGWQFFLRAANEFFDDLPYL